MRVPDVVQSCVCFLGVHKAISGNFGSLTPKGTGFFVSQPSEFGDGDRASFLYLVTAKHVIDGLKGAESGARINRKDGRAELVGLGKKWWFHPTDPDVDVAVIPFQADPSFMEDFGIRAFPTQGFATQEAIAKAMIGVGDEVFITGLFAHILGNGPNTPIVRMGNVALLAGEEPIRAGSRKMHAHLIESRSIGGLSGSPAFVRQTISIGFADPKHFEEKELWRQLKPGEVPESPLFITGIGPFWLLGLMHGHWEISTAQKNEVMIAEDQNGKVNMGIALVVPATRILEVINQPELAEMRRKVHEAEQKGSTPILDNLTTGLSDTEVQEQLTAQGFAIPVPTRDAFLRDLLKATRRQKPSS